MVEVGSPLLSPTFLLPNETRASGAGAAHGAEPRQEEVQVEQRPGLALGGPPLAAGKRGQATLELAGLDTAVA